MAIIMKHSFTNTCTGLREVLAALVTSFYNMTQEGCCNVGPVAAARVAFSLGEHKWTIAASLDGGYEENV